MAALTLVISSASPDSRAREWLAMRARRMLSAVRRTATSRLLCAVGPPAGREDAAPGARRPESCAEPPRALPVLPSSSSASEPESESDGLDGNAATDPMRGGVAGIGRSPVAWGSGEAEAPARRPPPPPPSPPAPAAVPWPDLTAPLPPSVPSPACRRRALPLAGRPVPERSALPPSSALIHVGLGAAAEPPSALAPAGLAPRRGALPGALPKEAAAAAAAVEDRGEVEGASRAPAPASR